MGNMTILKGRKLIGPKDHRYIEEIDEFHLPVGKIVEICRLGSTGNIDTKHIDSVRRGVVIADFPRFFVVDFAGEGGHWRETVSKLDIISNDVVVKAHNGGPDMDVLAWLALQQALYGEKGAF